MSWRVVILILLPVSGSSGCTLYRTTVRNVHNEPQLYCGDEKLEHRLRKHAKEALAECAGRHPKKVFTSEFRDGFEDGFVDFLDSGGPCLPPAMPPFKYRKHKYLSPEGHAKIRDYFLGFKYGVDVALATGLRPYMTIPVLVAEPGQPPPLNITVLPDPPDGLSTDPPSPPKPDTPQLPAPRPVDPKPVTPSIPLPKVGTPPGTPSPNTLPPPPGTAPPPPVVVPDKPKGEPGTSGKSARSMPDRPDSAERSHVPHIGALTAATAVIPAPIPIPISVRPAPIPVPVVTPPPPAPVIQTVSVPASVDPGKAP